MKSFARNAEDEGNRLLRDNPNRCEIIHDPSLAFDAGDNLATKWVSAVQGWVECEESMVGSGDVCPRLLDESEL